MKVTYPVIFTEVETNILIEVPDLGILTEANEEGKTKGSIADAIMMARDAIGLMGIDMQDDGKEIPIPNSKTYITEKDDIVTLVDVDFMEYRRRVDNRAVKKNCTIPYWLSIEAERAGINYSRILQDALIRVLGVAKRV